MSRYVAKLKVVREGHVKVQCKRVRSAKDVARVAREDLCKEPREIFAALLLDAKQQVIGWHRITEGTLDTSITHPRETFRAAIIEDGCAQIILVHNHPSGDQAPSREDKRVTHQMIEAGRIVGIPVVDHVIVTDDNYLSFAEAGMMR